MIIADTSVWIDFFRGRNSVQCRALRMLVEEEEDIAITGIILTEILQGIRNDKDYKKIKTYLLEFPVYESKGIDTYLRAAEIFRTCRKKGKTVRKTVDCIISAICIEGGNTLLHNDRDFDLIESCTPLRCYKA